MTTMKWVCAICNEPVGCKLVSTFVDCGSKICKLRKIVNFGCPNTDTVHLIKCDNCYRMQIDILEGKMQKPWRDRRGRE